MHGDERAATRPLDDIAGAARESRMGRKSEAIRVGLVGYGYAGKTFHAPLIQSVPDLALTIVGSSKPAQVNTELGEVGVCDPLEVGAPPDVDLVIIVTPNDSHFPIAAAALRAGKDVIVDKPFTVTLAEARGLVEIAEEQGRLLSVFHNRRWEGEVQATREILQSGRLGEVWHYECHLDRFRPTVRSRWREKSGPGAGLWFDLGLHLIDQALHLFGLPHSVNANFGILREWTNRRLGACATELRSTPHYSPRVAARFRRRTPFRASWHMC